MSGVNRVVLIGNLGANPDVKTTSSGSKVCKFSIATSEHWTTPSGKQERVEWHRVEVWNQLAELCERFLAKGKQVYVEGRLSYSSYEKEGKPITQSFIKGQKVIFLSAQDRPPQSREEGVDYGW